MNIVSQLNQIDVYKMLKSTNAILEGHFKLTSGYHSQYYLQCAKLLEHPDLTLKLIEAGLDEYKSFFNKDLINKTDIIVSPAIGGILFGYMLAFKISKKMIFTERKEKIMELRRGFEIKPNENVIIAEDVITTGNSVFEVIEICKKFKANILSIISIVDRSDNVKFEYPFFSFIKFQIEKFLPAECPLCKQGLDIIYPGSRKSV